MPAHAKRVSFAIGAASDDSDGIIDGDPDLYVTHDKGPKALWGTRPSKDYKFFSSTGDSREVLTITNTDTGACEDCVYRLAVYA